MTPTNPRRRLHSMRNLLWVDCVAGGTVGAAVLMSSGWLSPLYGLPRSLLNFTGLANLLYASYSLALASRNRRPIAAINTLVVANLAWALVCVYLAVRVAQSPTVFGLAHLFVEAVFVAALASLEWRWREQLLVAPSHRATARMQR
jgi:hypothetical protein